MTIVFEPDNQTCNSVMTSMELIIDKKRLHKIIDDLPDDSSLEDAIEQLILFHKVKLGLRQEGGRSQEELEREFTKRRQSRQKPS